MLLDPVNPIMYPEAYQLQKVRRPSTTNGLFARQLVNDEDMKQRANPYCTRI